MFQAIKNNFLFAFIGILTISCANDNIENESQSLDQKIEVSVQQSIHDRFINETYFNFPDEPTRVIFTGSTSAEINQFIKDQSSNTGNGVIIEIPNKTYNWTRINILSNTHLEFEAGTIVKASAAAPLFRFGDYKNGARTKNASISGKDGKRFTVDISNPNFTNKNIAVAKIGRVDNFRLADININDRRSSLNSILMVHVGGATEQRPGPVGGVVENITQTGAHTGYGLVQTYSAKNVLFKNLNCEGGVTLRMETDDRVMKEELKSGNKTAGVDAISAFNIINHEGLAAVMFSPHFINNGKVIINKVISNGSAFAVRVEKGFLELFDKDKTYTIDDAGKVDFKKFIKSQFPDVSNPFSGNPYKRNNGTQWAVRLSDEAINAPRNTYVYGQLGNLNIGTFTTSSVTNIKANYNANTAKIKQAYLKYIPCDKWSSIKNPTTSLGMFNGFEYHGPSVALSIDNTNESYIVRLRRTELIGFPSELIENIKHDTSSNCNNKPGTVSTYNASF